MMLGIIKHNFKCQLYHTLFSYTTAQLGLTLINAHLFGKVADDGTLCCKLCYVLRLRVSMV